MPLIPPMKLRLGRLLVTPGALAAITESGESPWQFLVRHMTGDWGDLDDEDKRRNDEAVKAGSRILSAYATAKGQRLWVITEADRSATTLLLPEEY
jgi:hypothetical protein